MPQVDLTSVCAGDPKVSCESQAVVVDDDSPTPEKEIPTNSHPDYAPESFWLSKDAELDWLDRNAFLDRRDSGKGSSTNLNPIHVSVGSQRYSGNLKSKASLIALPKPQKQNYAEVKSRRHCRPSSVRLFPKRSEPVGGKPLVALTEPGSPKVSCMGRVRSRKDRSRRGKNRKKVTEPGLVRVKSVKERKNGFWKNVRSIFRSKGNKLECRENQTEEDCVTALKKKNSSLKKKRGFSSNNNLNYDGSCEMSPVEPPGLGAMKRFASGRKSDAWAGDVEVDGAQSEPLGPGGPIWRRREVGPPVEIGIDRDWRTVGPLSV
ncbi:uncharacterized protein LOC130826709 [Amaranthus tricolor]|uniref:uncharacterized protein LOC130826709 n=1 Tax=Amaranthus tricolor TaxID=29722 RepID=UPI00258FF172|nr:uncharacterized protein LOC130826709 [Amaranthus tricolor]